MGPGLMGHGAGTGIKFIPTAGMGMGMGFRWNPPHPLPAPVNKFFRKFIFKFLEFSIFKFFLKIFKNPVFFLKKNNWKVKTLHFKTKTLSLSQFHTFISLLLLRRHLLYSVANCNPFYSLLISFFFNHLLQSSRVSIHEHNIIFFNSRFQYFLGIFFDFVLFFLISGYFLGFNIIFFVFDFVGIIKKTWCL